MTEVSVQTYLEMVAKAYENRGGIDHQRGALKTASGRRIRERMVRDIVGGAVLPPLVIGVVVAEHKIDGLRDANRKTLLEFLRNERDDHISIIDGMQRTTALMEAVEKNEAVLSQTIRLEMWFAHKIESLIYRMLILNSGQIPWNLKQQLRVVYEPLVDELYQKVDFPRLLTSPERRWRAGEFSSDDLIETYIAFGLRKTEVDTQENLAEEFSKLDISDALASDRYDQIFFPIVQMMVELDIAVSRFDPEMGNDTPSPPRVRRIYDRGKNIFDTQPPRIGFIVANAIHISGRIGMERKEEVVQSNLSSILRGHRNFIDRLNDMSVEELKDFLALDVLQEALNSRPTSAVGRWERSFWHNAFSVLIAEGFEVPSMEPCWRAG